MALYQRESGNEPALLRSRQSAGSEYQAVLEGYRVVCGISVVSHCSDNAAAEGVFSMLKRERLYRRQYQTVAEACTQVFGNIGRFYIP